MKVIDGEPEPAYLLDDGRTAYEVATNGRPPEPLPGYRIAAFWSTEPDGENELKWRTRYEAVCVNAQIAMPG